MSGKFGMGSADAAMCPPEEGAGESGLGEGEGGTAESGAALVLLKLCLLR